jgi:hypothetical protein
MAVGQGSIVSVQRENYEAIRVLLSDMPHDWLARHDIPKMHHLADNNEWTSVLKDATLFDSFKQERTIGAIGPH